MGIPVQGAARAARAGWQAALHLVYPPQCLTCDAAVASDFGLCGACWRDTPFLGGLVCDACGLPLPGEDPGGPVHCDDCLAARPAWGRGRAAMLYRDNARRIVLALKHGDRHDMARAAAPWLARAARPLIVPDLLVAPVPLHWTRLLARRYNQAALLSAGLARLARLEHCPDLLVRRRSTRTQDGRSRAGRFANMEGALALHPRRAARLGGRAVLIVDDVMTSGATLHAAAGACLDGGARSVAVLALARVAKDGWAAI